MLANDTRGDDAVSQESSDTTSQEPNEPGPVLLIRRLDNAVGLLEQALLALFLLVLVGIGVTQAIAVKLGVGLGVWSFEVLRYSVFFIAMTGAALSAHTGQLIAMDFVTRLLQRRARVQLQIVLRLTTIGACGLLIVGGLRLTKSVSTTGDAAIDPAIGLLALPVGAGLLALHVALHLAIDVIYLSRGQLPPESAMRSVH